MNNEYLAWWVICYEILIVNYSLFILWNGIVAGATPGVAAEDTFDAKPAAFEDAVFEDRFDHILAASRGEATGWRSQRGDESTVEIDGEEEKLSDKSFPCLMFDV
jgi:hypothetical protein